MHSESSQFDPYHKWLGIHPNDQPPHHYRLLGVDPFESDAEVIESAADRQMAHLRSFQTGTNAALSQRLLNEIAAARVALLSPNRKDSYDAELRTRLTPPAPISQSPAAVPRSYLPIAQAIAAPTPVFSSAAPSFDRVHADSSGTHSRATTSRRKGGLPGPVRVLGHVVASIAGLGLGYLVLCWIQERRPQPVAVPPIDRPQQGNPTRGSPIVTVGNPRPKQLPAGPISDAEIVPLGEITLEHEVTRVRLSEGESVTTDWVANWSQIPQGFDGWYFTKGSSYQGKATFQVNRSGIVVMGLNGDWGGGGSRGPWQAEVVSRESLELQGWRDVGQITTDASAIPYLLFARVCNAGEKFTIRNHKHAPPIFLAPTISGTMAQEPQDTSIPPPDANMAALMIEHELRWNSLEVGKRIPSTSQALEWAEIPQGLRGRRIASGNGWDGTARFKVKSAGPVLMAVVDHSKGESPVIQGLLSQGWQPVCRLSSRWLADEAAHDGNWLVLVRKCEAGESFTVSTDKYNAPILISPR